MIDQDMVNIVSKGGIIGLLVLIILSGLKRYWVFGWHYEQMQKERDEWKALAQRAYRLSFRGTRLTEESINLLNGGEQR